MLSVPSSAKERMFMFSFIPGQDSAVGITNRHGLDSAGSIPGGGQVFCLPPDLATQPTRLLYNKHRVFPGGKVAATWH
jgi:hypothetical protein